MDSIASQVVKQLISRNLTITAAESLTAGKFQSSLGDVPGVSSVFGGGLVTYSNRAKHEILGVPQSQIDQFGVVSKAVAISMADHAKSLYHADIALSFTGAAGPDALEGHPAGTVWLGIAFPHQATTADLFHFTGDRNQVRQQCVNKAYQLLQTALNN